MMAAILLIRRGYAAFCPQLSLNLDEMATSMEEPISYDEWLAVDLAFLRECDAVYCPEEVLKKPSKGVQRELDEAKKWAIPVFTDIEELPYIA